MGKKEAKPAYFGAHVKRTSFRKTGLVKSTKATGRSSYNTVRHPPSKLLSIKISPMGLPMAQNGHRFCRLLEYGPPTWPFSSLALLCRFYGQSRPPASSAAA